MNRQPIPIYEFNLNIFQAWDRGWYLLTAGDFAAGDFQHDDYFVGRDRDHVEQAVRPGGGAPHPPHPPIY